jgi:hypothetical protein
MRISKFTYFVVAALLLATFAVAASAQVTATGKVTLKQADGTEVPVKDALVQIYRTDIKQSFKTKTDKKGEYVYAGMDYVGTFTILVSAPALSPPMSRASASARSRPTTSPSCRATAKC